MFVASARNSPLLARIAPADTRPSHKVFAVRTLCARISLEMNFKHAIAGQQIVQVAVEKTILPDLFEQEMQEQPDVLHIGWPSRRHRQGLLDLPLEDREDRLEDLILVIESGNRDCRG
jgi:hypothetical protein